MGLPVPSACVALRIQPRASGDAVVGEREAAITIRLRAAPVDGAANGALIRFLARTLGVPQRAVRLVRGHSGRHKWVTVADLEPEEVRQRLLAGPAD